MGVRAHAGTKCSRDMSFGGDNSSLATSDSCSIVKQCPIYTPLVMHSLILAEIRKTSSSFQSQDGRVPDAYGSMGVLHSNLATYLLNILLVLRFLGTRD